MRLYLAFGLVAATTLLAGGVALVSYSRVGATLVEITRDRIPAMNIALRTARASAEIAASAPALFAARSTAETGAAMSALAAKEEELFGLIDRLGTLPGGADAARRLRDRGEACKAILAKLAAAVERRLSAQSDRAALLVAVDKSHHAFADALEPLIADISDDVDAEFASIEKKDRDVVASMLSHFGEKELMPMRALYELHAESNLVADLLNRAATVPEAAQLAPLRQALAAASTHLAQSMEKVKRQAEDAGLRQMLEGLLAFANGPKGVFAIREREIADRVDGEDALAASRKLAEQFGADVQELVAVAEGAANDAADRSNDAISSGRIVLSAIAGLSLLIAVATAWLYVGRNVGRRLAGLRESMIHIAGGALETAIPRGGSDELSEMAAALSVFRDNAVTARLAESRASAERAQLREARQQELLALAANFEDNVKGVVATVSSAADQMRATAESMVASADATSRQANNVASASSQAHANVDTVASAAEELAGSTSEIGRQVTESAGIARQAVDEAAKTNASVQSLIEAAQRIGNVVLLINNIAGQTNLLALNATIEAARAGDAGKGFAVVASEVKSLAGQTAKATEEIAAEVRSIQGATTETAGAIDGIGRTIARISEIATAIAAAVEQQDATTREIARNVDEAAHGTNEVSSNIETVRRVAGETGEAAQQVLGAAGELATQSKLLTEAVEQFLTNVRAA